ncbi:O-antigen polymerase [Citrobacter freundii]|nr:O-antigen polymerase [Citrobacter freundii]
MFPHTFMFLVFNLAYMLPIAYVHFFGFSQGGVEEIFNSDPSILSSMVVFYFVVLFFYLSASSLFGFRFPCKRIEWQVPLQLPFLVKVVFIMTLLALVISKILLYPEGVYSAYAFDSGAMESRVWNVSMGLSELGVLIFAFCVITKNTKFAFLTFLIVSLNLLHGTRVFTLIILLMIVFYIIFINKRINKIKLFVYLIVFFFFILLSFLAIFIYRSNVSITNINLDLIISPIVYESLFNQISFIRMLGWLHGGHVPFAPEMLFSDSAIFTLPSFLFDDKLSLMYINNYGELSPLGGLSGYASAIIYFSYYYFIWYFILGMVSSLLLRSTSATNFKITTRVLYIYFVCDSLFRFNRDPWFIVIKMLSNNLLFLLIILLIIALQARMYKRRSIQ